MTFEKTGKKFNKDKFKNVLHYIIHHCGLNNNVGKTVIYKLLYFSDFNYFELYEKPLTNESYRRLPHGPAPIHFDIVIDELIMEEKIMVKTKPLPFDRVQYKYKSLKEPIMNLKDNELKVIEDVIKKLSAMNASQISEYSHGDMPWRAAEDYELIKYSFVFYRDPQYRVRKYDSN
ncbi:MAG: hypothetical protein BZ136_09535 [Methanosphaera sp. rholeuAM74]|nr:MAG: hypothetical protein BZ136_09535 [Methanosphaera sp. rholeuAM74]